MAKSLILILLELGILPLMRLVGNEVVISYFFVEARFELAAISYLVIRLAA